MNRDMLGKYAALTEISERLQEALEKIDKFDDFRINFEGDVVGRRCEELRDYLIERTAEEIKAVVSARL